MKTSDQSDFDDFGDLAPGSQVGPYVILDALGRGGMGRVFLANDSRLHRKVALKCLLSSRTADDDLRHQILREARAVARITHPNVASVHDVIEHKTRAFMVMEYVEGESLAVRLRRERMPIDTVVTIGRQLASALAAAHENGVVHRDLKPANIQLTRNGDVKVLDFGVAKAVAMLTTASETLSEAPHVEAERQLGTPGYMSPEQILGGDVGPRSDLFSLGVVLYEMAAWKRLFSGKDLTEIIEAMSRPVPRADEIDATVPRGLSDILAKALEGDPGRRMQSAAEFEMALAELDRAIGQTEIQAPSMQGGAAASVESFRGRLLLAHSQPDLLRLKYEMEEYLAPRPYDVDARLLKDDVVRALEANLIGQDAPGRIGPPVGPGRRSDAQARRMRYGWASAFGVLVIAISVWVGRKPGQEATGSPPEPPGMTVVAPPASGPGIPTPAARPLRSEPPNPASPDERAAARIAAARALLVMNRLAETRQAEVIVNELLASNPGNTEVAELRTTLDAQLRRMTGGRAAMAALPSSPDGMRAEAQRRAASLRHVAEGRRLQDERDLLGARREFIAALDEDSANAAARTALDTVNRRMVLEGEDAVKSAMAAESYGSNQAESYGRVQSVRELYQKGVDYLPQDNPLRKSAEDRLRALPRD